MTCRCLSGREEHIGMQVGGPQPAFRNDLHSRFDHRWRASDIGFPAVEILEVLDDGIGHEACASARFQWSIGEDGRESKVGVPLRQILKMVDEIEIAAAARTEIVMDRLPHAVCNCRLGYPFDRRKARAAGDAQDRPGMLLAQVGRAEWPFDHCRITDLQLRMDALGRGPARHLADMEFEFSPGWLARHLIISGGSAREGKPSVLACRKSEWIAAVDSEPDIFDVVYSVIDRGNSAV